MPNQKMVTLGLGFKNVKLQVSVVKKANEKGA